MTLKILKIDSKTMVREKNVVQRPNEQILLVTTDVKRVGT